MYYTFQLPIWIFQYAFLFTNCILLLVALREGSKVINLGPNGIIL